MTRPRKAIGEANVTERMKIEKAVIGGEGNGGVKEKLTRVVAEAGSEAAVRRIIDDVFGRVARIVGVG